MNVFLYTNGNSNIGKQSSKKQMTDMNTLLNAHIYYYYY